MHIGDLPRARTSSRSLGRSVAGALFVLVAVGSALAGWQTLPSAEHDKGSASTAAAGPMDKVPMPQPVSPVRVANADPAVSGINSVPSVLPPKPAMDEASARVPALASDPEPATPPVSDASTTLSDPPPAASSDVTGAVATDTAFATAEPVGSDSLIDLNTGSFEDLNTLENGGPIGRAIIKGRPYASAEELVTKKVLRRSVYEQIKDQVTVR